MFLYYRDIKKILLENDLNLEKELNKLEPRYQVIRQIIELRKTQNLSQKVLALKRKDRQSN